MVLNGLNENQKRAVEAGDGPVMIIAGPGTGKTKTLVARIVRLVEAGRAKPAQILALTFTKKAAEEMLNRLPLVTNPKITTFHGLCYELLGGDAPFIGEAARLQLIKSLQRPKELKDMSARELALSISRAKNQTEIEDAALAKVVRAYDKALAAQGRRDFDDLLQETYKLLRDDSAARTKVQKRFKHLLVDEFQDTNLLQYEIMKLLTKHDNIFVIGDPNQSIYGFRGASGTIFENFKSDFPDYEEISLTKNYRSAPPIVRLSNSFFKDAPDLDAANDSPGLARAVQVLNEYGEAEWILGEIHRAIGGGDFLKAVSDDSRGQHRRLSDFAVLYRSRPAAQIFQKLLAESGLPYQVVGDGSPYDQPQIQAIISLMRAAVSGQPVELEGYGSAEQRYLKEQLDKAGEAAPSALVEKIIDILGLESSRDLQQFEGVLVRFKDVSSAIKYFDGIAESGFYDPAADAVTLLTIHASKGLEFTRVFLIGAEEGLLPSARGEEAEEKRLFYVAATRAREQLDITHARNRGGQKAEPSRYITALPDEILNRHADPDMDAQARRIAKRAAKNSQQTLF